MPAGLRSWLAVGALGASAMLAPSAARADTFIFSSLAGNGVSLAQTDGAGSSARFYNPTGIAVDTAGNIYVADGGDHTVRKVTAGGVVTTIAGASGQAGSADGVGSNARFVYPFAVATDLSGNVFVTDVGDHTVKRITPAGLVTTLGGTAGVAGSVDGVTTSAQFNYPEGVAADAVGNIFVSDTGNSTIRKIAVNGTVSTFAGVAGQTGTADGNGGGARFNFPAGIAADSAGNIYVADHGNSTIRKITSGGTVTTLAGSAGQTGSGDGPAASATFDHPNAVSVDSAGNVYVIDTSNQLVRKISINTGSVTTLSGAAGFGGNVDGAGLTARFFYPFGIAVTGAGSIYVADTGNHTIRTVSATGNVGTLAGAAGVIGSTDGTGGGASFAYPAGLAADAGGTVFVADRNNHTIRKVATNGSVSTLAGAAGLAGSADGAGAAARFNGPSGVAADSSGNVYVADTGNNAIRKITSSGAVSTFASGFNGPQGVAVDTLGNVYVADTGNNTIRKITATGTVTTLAGAAGQTGNNDGTGAGARFNGPIAIAVNSTGTIFVADFSNGTIRKITSTGIVTTLAGLAGQVGDTDGFGTAARFNQTYAIAADNSGNVFVADTNNRAIRKIDATGNVSTINGASSRFYYPQGLAIDASGNLYVADGDNQSISKGLFVALPPSGTVIGDQTVAAGGSTSFTVGAPNAQFTYQWQLSTDGGATWVSVTNGTTYSGALSSTLSVSNAAAAMNGTKFRALLTNAAGTSSSAVGTLTVSTTTPPPTGSARLINLSVRTQVGTGANTVFVGFALNGTGSKQMLIRGVGPTLTQFNVTGVLAQPQLTLYNSASAVMATNAGWGGSAAMAATFSSVGAFALPPTSADSALVRALTPAAYTAQISGVNNTTGIALAEFYDADSGTSTTRLYNLSARATVGSGVNSLVAGFVIGGGTGNVTLLIRGIGPSLAQFNLTGVLAAPQLTLFDANNTPLQSNAGWGGSATLSAAFDQVGAFQLSPTSADCAMLVTLPPGLYTAQISSGAGAPGLGLIEVYEIR